MPERQPMSDLMERIKQLGAAHRELRHQRDEADRRLRAICSELAEEIAEEHEDLFEDEEEPDYFDQELIEFSAECLLDPAQLTLASSELRQILEEARNAALPRFEPLLADARLAETATVGPARAFGLALQNWLVDARADAGTAARWPEVLSSWRSALNLTVRDTASALQVSASAITRYESGARSPSLPQLTALVEAMSTWDPVNEQSELRRSSRRLADSVGWDPESLTERIDKADSERHHLQGLLEDIARDQSLSAERLGTLVALAQNPAALDHVRSLASFDLIPDLKPTSSGTERPAAEASRE